MNFGDLIKYPHIAYKHYAMYTGRNEKGQDTVVEFTGESGSDSKKNATVKQSLFDKKGVVDNSLDTITGLTPKSEKEMKAAIEQLFRDGPGKYGVLDNNCEHLVTKIRYGKPISLQADRVLKTEPNFNNEMSENMGASFFPRLK